MTTTNNAVNVPLSGSTGTVNFVGSTSPTLITPVLGAATATSVAFSPTTGGIIGTTAADNAGSGKVGEFISSNIAFASAISISNATFTNLTSITLSAGDWDVWGNIYFIPSGGGASNIICGISTTTATIPDASLISQLVTTTAIMTNMGFIAPQQRINVSGSTPVYIVGYSAFFSTCTMCGGIYARRVR